MFLENQDVKKNLFCLDDLRDRARQFWIFWPAAVNDLLPISLLVIGTLAMNQHIWWYANVLDDFKYCSILSTNGPV